MPERRFTMIVIAIPYRRFGLTQQGARNAVVRKGSIRSGTM
jgi:hypothetical protein